MSFTRFQLELTNPWWLVAIVAVPWLFYYFYRSLVDFLRWQRRVSLITRSMITLLLVLALAGLTLLQPTHDQFVIFAVDRSVSVGSESAGLAEKFIDDAVASAGHHRFALLPFDREPGALQQNRPAAKSSTEDESPAKSQSAASSEGTPGGIAPNGSTAATNVAAAIESAAGAISPSYVPLIVLISDGNETMGDSVKAALRAGMPISTVPLPTRSDPEVQVSAVTVPAQVREGEPFFVEVIVDSNHDDEGQITVFRGAHQVVSERSVFKKGENRFRFQQSITSDRLAEFAVRVSDVKQDTLVDNNAERGLVFTSGKPRVLIVESDPKLIRELTQALEQEEIAVDVRPPQGMPDSLSDLQNYELVIISNVPATALSQRQMEVARTYVQDLGGGLMMLGGEQSFGLGGYYKTVLEEVLPVRSDFEKEKEKPSLGMVLVIDKSGSMSGDKIEMAKSAARSAVELLAVQDKIGVVAFDGETYVISDMQSASNKGRVSDDISRIDAGGGTTMYPAMAQAYEMLQQTSAKLKHVIVLTDGISSPGDFQGLAQQMIVDRITVSTVAVGGDSDTHLLQDIANVGQGRFYATEDPASIPQIFAKETVTASKSAIDEQPFVPQVVRASQAMAGIDLETAPFLLGYVMTRPKSTSEVILATEKGDPLLAWWRYGLGMTVGFTSDAKSRWGAEWLTWPGYGKFWAQLVRHTMRKTEAKGVTVQVEQRGGRASVTVDAIDTAGQYLNQADTEMTVIDPQLGTEKIRLLQTAPGRYVADFATKESGAYHLDLTQQVAGQLVYRQSRGLVVGYSDELRLRPTNEALLRQIAATSGGAYNPTPASIFQPTERLAQRPTALWPWLLTAALLLFVLDVALRRIDLSVLPFVSKTRLEASAGFASTDHKPRHPKRATRERVET